MKMQMYQIDIRDVRKTVEPELNAFVEKLEKAGNRVISENVAPESTGVKNFFIFAYEKGIVEGIQYKFLVFDVRGGITPVNNQINEEISKLEKSGREIVRYAMMPRSNSAFTQILLAHVPAVKKSTTSTIKTKELAA